MDILSTLRRPVSDFLPQWMKNREKKASKAKQFPAVFTPPITNRRLSEAKAFVYSELAIAAENGLNLTEAAQRIGQSEFQHRRSAPGDVKHSTETPETETISKRDHTKRTSGPLLEDLIEEVYPLVIMIRFLWGAASTLLAVVLPNILLTIYAAVGDRLYVPRLVCRRIGKQLYSGLNQGLNLSDAMMAARGYFTPLECKLVSMAETNGTLSQTLKNLAIRSQDNRLYMPYSTMGIFIAYIMLASSITTFLNLFVVPKFVDIYVQLGQTGGNLQWAESHDVIVTSHIFILLAASCGAVYLSQIGTRIAQIAAMIFSAFVFVVVAQLLGAIIFSNLYDLGPSPSKAFDGIDTLVVTRNFLAVILATIVLTLPLTAIVFRRSISRYGFVPGALLPEITALPGLREITGRAEQEAELLRVVAAGVAARLPEKEIATCLFTNPPSGFRNSLEKANGLVHNGVPLIQGLVSSDVFTGYRKRRMEGIETGAGLELLLNGAVEDMDNYSRSWRQRTAELTKIVFYTLLTVFVYQAIHGGYNMIFLITPTLMSGMK